jgi:hypothetical protein
VLLPTRVTVPCRARLFEGSTGQQERAELASAIIRATGRPCSVTTIVPPFLTSRTHSLNFDFSSRIPMRRSAMTPLSRDETTFYHMQPHHRSPIAGRPQPTVLE